MRTLTLPAAALAAVLTVLPSHARQPARVPDTLAQRAVACAACHGEQGRATSEGFYPRIAAKPEGYLYNQLLNFRDGRRKNPAMTHMVSNQSDAYLMELARYFASLNPPYPPAARATVARQVLERGRVLALQGDPARRVPACIGCHGQQLTGVKPAIPGLLGLPRDYLNAQFGAWRNGTRKAASPDCMAQVTARMTPEDINAVSAWLSSQPLPADMKPAAAIATPLPLSCGAELP